LQAPFHQGRRQLARRADGADRRGIGPGDGAAQNFQRGRGERKKLRASGS